MESPYPQQFPYGSLDSKSPVGNHGDQSSFGNHGNSSKLHAENEYLKERVRSCEKGLSGLYQVCGVRVLAYNYHNIILLYYILYHELFPWLLL